MASAESTSTAPTAPADVRSPLHSALVGLATLGVLLQGVWAGLFMGGVSSGQGTWEHVHQIGAYATTALGIAAAVVAVVQLRPRRDVVLGSIAFALLLVVEVGIGSSIENARGLQALHFPVAMALLALAVWLPMRVRHRG